MNHLTLGSSPWNAVKGSVATIIVAGALALHPQTTRAQDAGALVDKLVSKGILSSEEAKDVRADMMKDFSQTPAGKINLSSSITELKLYGQFRYRWQYDDREAQIASPNHVDQRSRHRFRLTIGADAKLADNFYAGFALETGQSAKAAVQTYENGFDDYGIFISKAFLGWKNDWLDVTVGKIKNPFYTTDMVWDPDITPQGLFETIAFHKMSLFDGSGGPSGDPSKDGKATVQKKNTSSWELSLVAGQMIFDDNNEFAVDSDLSTDAYLFVEQLIATYRFDKDTSITLAPAFMSWTAADLSGLLSENAFTDAGIIGSTTSTRTTTSTVQTTVDTVNAAGTSTTRVVTPTTVVSSVTTITNPNGTTVTTTNATTVRPGAPSTTIIAGAATPNRVTTTANTVANASTATPATPVGNSLAAISGETRAMHILTAPGDISFKIGGLKTKLYWDMAYNFTGRERYDDIYQLRNTPRSYETRDSLAWLVGVQLGGIKKKGDWEAYLNYRETGIASVDSNLNDKDFALSELNMRGFKLALSYALSDAVVVSVKGLMAWNLDSNLTGGRATNSVPGTAPVAGGIAESNAVNVVQVDVAVKF